jgi:hypothetical protein
MPTPTFLIAVFYVRQHLRGGVYSARLHSYARTHISDIRVKRATTSQWGMYIARLHSHAHTHIPDRCVLRATTSQWGMYIARLHSTCPYPHF